MSTIDLQALLRDEFGFESFRPGQERIVRDLLDGRDVLAVLPTGAGKSLTFQLTAQLVQGITLVVSPLLALMKDQVHALAQRGLPAASVSGSPSDRQIEHMLESHFERFQVSRREVWRNFQLYTRRVFMKRFLAHYELYRQIQNLPTPSRNFLDLAQLEPGVQIQDVELERSSRGRRFLHVSELGSDVVDCRE